MIRITKIGTVLVLAFLFCSSCADNSIDSVNGSPGIQGKTVRLMLSSSSLQASGGTSRSVGEGMNVSLGSTEASATRAVTEDKIDNVCVFQFSGSAESSTAVLKSKTYVSDLIDRTLDVSLISSPRIQVPFLRRPAIVMRAVVRCTTLVSTVAIGFLRPEVPRVCTEAA